jgi:hypothetical protein
MQVILVGFQGHAWPTTPSHEVVGTYRRTLVTHSCCAAVYPASRVRTAHCYTTLAHTLTTHPSYPFHHFNLMPVTYTMPTVIREIDPDYDTVIVLEQPCKNFAPWNPTNEILKPDEPGPELEAWPASLEDCCDDAVPTSIADDNVSTGHIDPEAKAGASLSRAYAHPTETELPQDVSSSQNDRNMETIENTIEDEEEIVHYYVSSRHLTLVSPWFKRTLTSTGSKEAVPDPQDGRFYISASGWDEEAFLILLNIFHLRKRQIPKTISLELFAKIAVLVDYYELKKAEAIEDYVDIWAAHTRHSYAVPTSYGRDLVLWMCVSAIFDLSDEFEKATAVAIQRSTGLIRTLSLPIPLRAIRRFPDVLKVSNVRTCG